MSWVQVLGRIAVHQDGEQHRLTGSGQRLLAVFVAAGLDGATSERIADEIWGDQQPDPWRPALRMAVARLRKQLPPDWDVIADGGSYRIATSDGWIDAWRLEELASARSHIDEDDLGWMLAGRPFGDLDPLELVGSSTQSLQMLQIAVAERFCAQRPESVSTGTCSALTALLRNHPYNDRLAVVVAEALAASGRRTEAVLALTAFCEAYATEFERVPDDIARFLADRGEDHLARATAAALDASPPPAVVAKELRHLLDSPLLGRADELAALQKTTGALITGPRGSGKSRLLAALIVGDPATETTYVLGDDRLDLALGPFAVAMPKLRDELLASGHEEDPPGTRDGREVERAQAARSWRIVLGHLEACSVKRPQRLVVDDAHRLDPASLGLLRLLIRSNTAARITFIVCGRSDSDDSEWLDLVRDGERAGLDPMGLAGLQAADFAQMVYQQFPKATHQSRQGLARDVFEASGGLPAVAAPLIASADPTTLALPEQLSGASALTRVTASLSERAPEVIAAAAVLGHQFSIGALIALTELDEASIFRLLDELWSKGLIIETDDPDQVRFRHVLIQRAFLDGVPLFRRGQLHRRAAELTDDPHERADHQANASALVPAEVAAASLRESARLYAERRSWRKVTRELRRIERLPGDHLDIESLILWAAALDQSGSDGAAQRSVAYERAIQAEAWELALDAALSGLPQAELPDGDAERIAMLEGIAGEDLPPSRRFDLLYHLARQYSLVGDDGVNVLKCADKALAIAADADERGLSHVLRWMATRHISYEAHDIPLAVINQGSPRIRMRVAQVNAISLAERGEFDAARSESDRFAELAASLGDPLRIWQAEGLRSMFVLNSGDFEVGEQLADENRKFAELHDLQSGMAAYLGQRLYSFDCQDRLAELYADLEPFRPDMSRVLLGRAGLLIAGYAAGHTDVAHEIRAVFLEAQQRPGSSLSLLASLLLTRHLPTYATDLVPQARTLLARFGDRPILAGFGASNFGPTTMYLAQLTTDPIERVGLVDQSVRAADRQGPLLWRVRTRLDRADLGSADALEEATLLASGSQLEAVVLRRAQNMRD